MKFPVSLLAPLSAAFLFVSCDQKSEPAGDSIADKAAEGLEKAVDKVVGEGGVDARAEQLGFAAHLPKDTECVVGIYRGKELVEQVRGSALGKWLEARSKEEGVDLDEMEENPQAKMAGDLLGNEALIAFGKGTGKASAFLAQAADEANYMSARQVLGEVARLTGAEPSSVEELMLARVDQYLDLLETAAMPPVTVALAGGQDSSEQALQLVLGGFDEMRAGAPQGIITDLEVEKAGGQMTGFQVNGPALADFIKGEMGEEVPLSDAQVERAMAWIKSRNLVLLAGVLDSHLVIMAGPSVDDCRLVSSAANSVLAREEMSFIDSHLGNPVHAAVFASASLQQQIAENSSSLAAYARGVKEGLAEIPAFGDLRDVVALIDRVVEIEGKMTDEVSYSDFGLVAFAEDGFKIEGYGGKSLASLDSSNARKFAPMASQEDLLLFANWKGDAQMAGLQGQMVDTVGELIWVLANKAAATDVELPDLDLDQLRGILKMLEEPFGEELELVIQALRGDLPDGLGSEGAVILDLNGEVPGGIPEVPGVIVENGKLPRVSFAFEVTDRSKVQSAWKALEKAIKSVLEKTEADMTMPSFITSEKDGMTTYIYPFPFLTDDFVPNITVSDEVLYASTSKNFVYDLNGSLATGSEDQRRGAVVDVNFRILRAYAESWLKLIDENIDKIAPNEAAAGDFKENKKMVEELIATLGNLDSFTYHLREEKGQPRLSLHLSIK